MDRIAITGGARLNGTIPVSGAKNSAIKLMAASLLTDEPLRLTNMPRLADTRFLGKLLSRLGVSVTEADGADGQETVLHAPEITSGFAPYDLVRQMRASFNVLGPLVARSGQAKVSLPGGCTIGARPVDLHLQALEALGAKIDLHEGYVYAQAPRGLKGAEITFPFVSVGATEHAMLAAVLADGVTVIHNAACEPELVDLQECLNAMGAKVEGAGTPTVTITGVARLKGATHAVIPDRIEMGTYAVAAAMAGGEVRLTNARPGLIDSLLVKLEEAGAGVEHTADGCIIRRNGDRLNAVDIETQPFPGFATDLQAQFMALMTTANGESRIRETIFENRFMHAPELMRLGADISVSGGEARVRGVTQLEGAEVMATDLRASVSLVIAGLVARGETTVSRIYHLDRGFERLEEKLGACGAQVRRITGDGEAEL
ncbi:MULTISPECIES: UDP-N-acetylglucosamine 1-carboxyvinyltransferase [unclassified Caulobacter]|jgi:UDP-N-acetylglucosamine 1-carboxyvinyltransferase|uniref:UDP-N-acetylglucosamine 1-carboxyvinyltransferase n=1 Tax=unclassified Caulobacter TaxID=2648921 RepID=UPI0006455805|nr:MULTISPECIES: UDP-N-acetylglucosamine 1-carboxyvinyltransferase [unclassified Caulobacter]KQV58539.1 UDP-N-acetylglucosamine 1-carboxyvinyltransferase [Caulobacter sp. Root342]KQV68952.1 UDP-N-acetylglucosamine 1-carboxyvinyltransferase [Caulobacter sp. Root343]